MTYVYDFDERCEGGRRLLGGKGAGLAEMTQLGLPVPRGFTITTAACIETMRTGTEPAGLAAEIDEHLTRLERATGKRFGDTRDPLLLSVRSGGPVSMPGMMETILDLGSNAAVADGIARTTGDRRFAYDAYRRLIQMYGEVVAGIDPKVFANALDELKRERGVELDSQLTGRDFERLAARFASLYRENAGDELPSDPRAQLSAAIRAVFESWNAPRAQVYRHEEHIPDDLGTGVNVMEMVFGNRDARSATGV